MEVAQDELLTEAKEAALQVRILEKRLGAALAEIERLRALPSEEPAS